MDGGNSETRALLIDADGAVLGYGTSGNANHQGQGYDNALRNVAATIYDACRQAGLTPNQVTAIHFALAGNDVADDHARLTEGLRAELPETAFTLSNDVWAGLRAGATGGTGVAVNCGSGCGSVGRSSRGESIIIPDLGWVYGDSGGGRQIANDALRAVVRAWDGRGEPTILTALLLDLLGLPDVQALYMALYRGQIADDRYRRMTRLVFQAAAGGDGVAAAILQRIGDELGVSAAAVTRRLGMQEEPFTLVLTGGTFRSLTSPLATATIARVRATAPHCRPTLPLLMPVGGAALMALDAAGVAVHEDHYCRLRDHGYGWHPEENFS